MEIITIEQLIARGRHAYVEVLKKRRAGPVMGIESLFIVTRDDFFAHTEICYEVLRGRASLYIIDANGTLDALLCRHRLSQT